LKLKHSKDTQGIYIEKNIHFIPKKEIGWTIPNIELNRNAFGESTSPGPGAYSILSTDKNPSFSFTRTDLTKDIEP